MQVNIMTDHGHMRVDLDRFFPATKDKVRKLFTLMRNGLLHQEQEVVRDYLKQLQRQASATKAFSQGEVDGLALQRERLDTEYQSVLRKRAELRKKTAEAKERLRKAERMERSVPGWLRMFDDICGGVGKEQR